MMSTIESLDTFRMSRKADRETLAQIIVDLAEARGAKCERQTSLDDGIAVDIKAARGLCVTVHLVGNRRSDCHVLSWHIHYTSDARIADGFGHSINISHRYKATCVLNGHASLYRCLDRCLRMAEDGSAFVPESITQPKEPA